MMVHGPESTPAPVRPSGGFLGSVGAIPDPRPEMTPEDIEAMHESQDEAAVLMALMRHGFVKVKGWIAHYEGSTLKGAK